MMPKIRIDSTSSVVATGRRMKGSAKFMMCVPRLPAARRPLAARPRPGRRPPRWPPPAPPSPRSGRARRASAAAGRRSRRPRRRRRRCAMIIWSPCCRSTLHRAHLDGPVRLDDVHVLAVLRRLHGRRPARPARRGPSSGPASPARRRPGQSCRSALGNVRLQPDRAGRRIHRVVDEGDRAASRRATDGRLTAWLGVDDPGGGMAGVPGPAGAWAAVPTPVGTPRSPRAAAAPGSGGCPSRKRPGTENVT